MHGAYIYNHNFLYCGKIKRCNRHELCSSNRSVPSAKAQPSQTQMRKKKERKENKNRATVHRQLPKLCFHELFLRKRIRLQLKIEPHTQRRARLDTIPSIET